MKKTILLSSAILILAASAAAFVIVDKTERKNITNSMFEANIDALSNGEEGIYGTCEESRND